MKKITLLVSAAFIALGTFAQAPNLLSYQAIVRNSSGALVTNQAVGMQISILQSSASGTAVYVETQTPMTDANGLVSLEIGNGTAVTGTMAGINWANGPYFIKTQTDPTGGINYTITGTSQLLSVPYALNAGNGNWTQSDTNIYNSNTGNVGIGTTSPSAHLQVEGTAFPQLRVRNPTGSSATVDLDAFGGDAAFRCLTNGTVNGNFGWDYVNNNLRMVIYGEPLFSINLAQTTGFVGIGTATPAAQLDVESTNRVATQSVTNYACGTFSDEFFDPSTQAACVLGQYSGTGPNDGVGVFGVSTSGASNDGEGVIGIGNYIGVTGYGETDGFSALYGFSNGASYALYSDGNSYFNGDIAGAGTYSYTSDAKLKKNITPINTALNSIMQLKPSTYEYRVGEFGSMHLSSGQHYGVIAQDLQQVLPELVKQVTFHDGKNKNASFDYLSVNYIELIPLLIKGMQEQQAMIQQLQKELKNK